MRADRTGRVRALWRAGAAVAVAAALLTGCGDDDTSASESVNDDTAPEMERADDRGRDMSSDTQAGEEPADDESGDERGSSDDASDGEPGDVEVVGVPQVFVEQIPLQDTTGWSSVVAFEVANPTDRDLSGVGYHVEISSDDGATAARSSGDDRISVRAGETRWVVTRIPATGPSMPTTADVTMSSTASDDDPSVDRVHTDLAEWTSENWSMSCDDEAGCEATADVTFHGTEPQLVVAMGFLAWDGADRSGPLVFAGVGDVDANGVRPGFAIPVSGRMLPHATAEPGREVLGDVLVFSVPF